MKLIAYFRFPMRRTQLEASGVIRVPFELRTTMTMPKKGRRTITVDGSAYHWMVEFNRSERVVIQDASGCGSCLFVFPHQIMTPRFIAEAIRFAISNQWRPGQSAPSIWMAFDLKANKPVYELIPADDYRVRTYSNFGKPANEAGNDQEVDTRPWYKREIVR